MLKVPLREFIRSSSGFAVADIEAAILGLTSFNLDAIAREVELACASGLLTNGIDLAAQTANFEAQILILRLLSLLGGMRELSDKLSRLSHNIRAIREQNDKRVEVLGLGCLAGLADLSSGGSGSSNIDHGIVS